MNEEILGVPVWFGNKRDFLDKVCDWISKGEGKKVVATVNPEFVMVANKDKVFGELLKKTDLNVADGVGLIWARELETRNKKQETRIMQNIINGFVVGVEIMMGKHRENLLPGAELILDLCQLAAEKKWKVMLLGGWGDRAKRAALNLQSSITNLQNNEKLGGDRYACPIHIESCQGSPDMSNFEVIKRINKFNPDILLVAYGMKKQEEWIMENRERIDFGVAMGVGRSFDYYSGDLQRAPMWVRRSGFEWLYSLIKEPKRWRRQLVLPQFVVKIIFG